MAIAWMIWAKATDDGNDPYLRDRDNREAAMYDLARSRYTNVARKRKVHTVRHKQPGKEKGTGSGGAASNKS